MDRHRSLYKENTSMLSPRQHNRLNRDLQHANRIKQRKANFQSGRPFEVSPTPGKKPPQENKENAEAATIEKDTTAPADATLINKSRIALAAVAAVKADKVSRQEAFLLRFIEWRQSQKEREQAQKLEKKKVFVPLGGGNVLGVKNQKVKEPKTAAPCSFVPKNYEKFVPPAGLKNPAMDKQEPKTANEGQNSKLRKSFYSVVSTPQKKEKPDPIKKLPHTLLQTGSSTLRGHPTPGVSARRPAAVSSVKSALNVKQREPAASTSTAIETNSKKAITQATKGVAAALENKKAAGRALSNGLKPATRNMEKPAIAKTATANATNTKTNKNSATTATVPDNKRAAIDSSVANGIKKGTARALTFGTTATTTKTTTKPAQPTAAPKTFVKPQAPAPRGAVGAARIIKPVQSGINKQPNATGAVGKARMLQSKRVGAQIEKGKAPQRNAKLATSFKAKSKCATSVSNQATEAIKRNIAAKKMTVNGNTLLAVASKTNEPVPETPTDFLGTNAVFVASTGMKSLSPHAVNLKGMCAAISPVKTLSADEVETKKTKSSSKTKSRFNFVRYSGFDLSGVMPQEESVVETGGIEQKRDEKSTVEEQQLTVVKREREEEAALSSTLVATVPSTQPSPVTPVNTKSSSEAERPVNYLSPFVSVSRGKVSSKKEKEKRNSVYIPHVDTIRTTTTTTADTATTPVSADNPAILEARRTLETVRYFRQQLNNETERLQALCAQWEQYKDEQLELLQENGGEDMINVTIGQTKLLTSKKFKQFSGLIERCETGARNLAAGIEVVGDGSEDTKPINGVDLEGFWYMMGLQVENVDKRFENLSRWRSNEWRDPDEVVAPKVKPVKNKPQLSKVKKTKPPAKASSGLQQMLRQMHAEMRKNKAAAAKAETLVENNPVDTPTKNRKRRSQSGTPCSTDGRISVVVRDRKMHSAVPTVISIPANAVVQRRLSRGSISRRPSLDSTPKTQRPEVEELQRSIGKLQEVCRRNELLRAAITKNAGGSSAKKEKRKSLTPAKNCDKRSPMMGGRKSILKTPGTAKGKPKSVIFNEQLRVRQFKFTLEGDPSDGEEEAQELQLRMRSSLERNNGKSEKIANKVPAEDQTDEEVHTYSLRTRNVKLRPSCEIVIPK